MSIINDLTPAIVDVTIPQGSYTGEFFNYMKMKHKPFS